MGEVCPNIKKYEKKCEKNQKNITGYNKNRKLLRIILNNLPE